VGDGKKAVGKFGNWVPRGGGGWRESIAYRRGKDAKRDRFYTMQFIIYVVASSNTVIIDILKKVVFPSIFVHWQYFHILIYRN
jgi:hypothetical protein